MMKLVSAIIFVLFLSPIFAQTNYYVSLSGNDGNTGLSEAQAWRTISHAVSATSPVSAGDIVNVKAGDYGAEHLVFVKSGTAGSPITFEGYKNNPGNQPNLNYNFGDALDATVMPMLDGGDRATSGSAMEIESVSYIVIKNFQVKHYQQAVYSRGAHHITLENMITLELGDVTADYDGVGFSLAVDGNNGLGGNNNQLKNCIVTNAAVEGISISGNNNLIENCKIYCNDNSTVNASTDYYIVVDGNNNYISGCYIERIGDLAHGGAGIGVKEDAENNLFENCVAKDLKNGCFYVRYRGAKYNEFRNCHAIGTLADVNGFLVRDGASYNTFNSCFSENCSSSIVFLDTGEDGGAQYCGRYNVFNNCIIQNSIWAIGYSSYNVASPADNNTFVNCDFVNGDYLVDANRENYDNKLINCVVSDITNLKTGSEPLNMIFTFSDFYNSFSTPSGIGNISTDPRFVDAANGDYHLQATSGCIDVGTATDAPNTDYEGTARPQGTAYDIGAFEWSNVLPISLVDFVALPMKKCEGVKLNWTTESEINSRWFVIERSVDLQTWSPLASVQAKGGNFHQVSYVYEDWLAPKSRLLYYRFKEMDWDGQEVYSPIKTILLGCSEEQVHIFPNPSSGLLNVESTSPGQYEIRRMDGTIVMSGHLEKQLDVSMLPVGVYYLKFWINNQVFTERLVID